jgi:hypothetical protein
MKSIIFSLALISMFCFDSFSQNSTANLKFTYPVCSLLNEHFITETNDIKTFVINDQMEFDKYFKVLDNHKINFENNVVLVGFVGKDNFSKNINLNGATYNTKKSVLYIKYDIKDKSVGTCGKYCVLIVPKVEYKKILFLKGKKYARKSTPDFWG